MALLASLITCGFQLVAISVDFLIVVKFLPLSNKQLRTHANNFQGSLPAARPLSRVWSIMKLILRFSISIIKDWSGSPSLQVSPRIKLLAGHRNSNGSTTLYIRSKLSLAKQMVVDIHQRSDGGLEVRSPHALQLTDSVNSEFFAPVGNTPITSRETEDLMRTCYLPSVRQHLTAFDRDNTAVQQPTNVLPELPR